MTARIFASSMSVKNRMRPLFTGALVSAVTLAAQQAQPPLHKPHVTETNVAVLFNFERAQVAQAGSPSFWLKGGAADASVTLWKGLGIAANFTGEHASGIASNVSLGKIAFMAGPRYTFNTSRYTDRALKKHRSELFGEWLFGGAHAFDSAFPGTCAEDCLHDLSAPYSTVRLTVVECESAPDVPVIVTL